MVSPPSGCHADTHFLEFNFPKKVQKSEAEEKGILTGIWKG